MRIAVVGVGGIGGYYGGKLALEYEKSDQHEIVFIARGEHLKAIQENGLHLKTRERDYVIRPQIVTDGPTKAGVFDLVFFCTKSYSLERAAQQFSSCIHKNTVVISLLNGVNNHERLRVILPQANILNGCVHIISVIERPGFIHEKEGPSILSFGTDDETAGRYQYILDILLQAKINAVLTDQISKVVWGKYMLICPLASLASAYGKTYGEITGDGELRQRLRRMMEEVIAVAHAHKIILPDDAVEGAIRLISSVAYDNKTSMQLDRERGRQSETDIIPGFLCKAGKESGVPTPLHDEVYAQLK